jgi:hypothetical protein
MAKTKTRGERVLDEFQMKFTEVSQFKLDQLDTDRRLQGRDTLVDGEWAPTETVKQFAEQMGYTPFDAIIVTSDGWLIDGNTRVGARLRRKEGFHPAYVLEIAHETADESTLHRLNMIAAELNVWGKAYTLNERRKACRHYLAEGFTYDQIGQRLGLSRSQVSQVRAEADAEQRMTDVGIAWDNGRGELSIVAKRALGRASALTLHDQPYEDLVELALDADLKSNEIDKLVVQLAEAGSDQEQVDKIATVRVENADRIREVGFTGRGRPSLPNQLRQHLGFVMKYAGERYVERNLDAAQNHLACLEASYAILGDAITAQKAHDAQLMLDGTFQVEEVQ